jgi:hypothetical protein
MDLDGPAGKITGAAGIGAVALRRRGEVYLATNFRIKEGLDQRLENAAALIEPVHIWRDTFNRERYASCSLGGPANHPQLVPGRENAPLRGAHLGQDGLPGLIIPRYQENNRE